MRAAVQKNVSLNFIVDVCEGVWLVIYKIKIKSPVLVPVRSSQPVFVQSSLNL